MTTKNRQGWVKTCLGRFCTIVWWWLGRVSTAGEGASAGCHYHWGRLEARGRWCVKNTGLLSCYPRDGATTNSKWLPDPRSHRIILSEVGNNYHMRSIPTPHTPFSCPSELLVIHTFKKYIYLSKYQGKNLSISYFSKQEKKTTNKTKQKQKVCMKSKHSEGNNSSKVV